jgi:hypothetical protein
MSMVIARSAATKQSIFRADENKMDRHAAQAGGSR